ncbi:MAG: hypothetical protein JW850_12405 [Thermoflexales bacterium]|nr:hypothetical protein [Thermoflexales bacterium]
MDGIPNVCLGPGDDRLAHTANEHIPLDQVFAAARAYTRLAMIALNGGTGKYRGLTRQHFLYKTP